MLTAKNQSENKENKVIQGSEQLFKSIDALNDHYMALTRSVHAELVEKKIVPDIGPFFVTGDGTGKEPVILVGEAPGKDEVSEGRPFVGAAGKILDDLLVRSGIRRDGLYITNTVKYRLARAGKREGTYANRPVKRPEIEICSEWLRAELLYIKPKLVLTLGNTALQGILRCVKTDVPVSESIGDIHGRIIEVSLNGASLDFLLIPLYHPASLIYNRQLKVQYELDLEEVKKCAQSIL
ncbi:MAG: uracil-DNA glycosylase [Clostridia bacterium]|nr:uracil-DNA glycosylase [Clostridia bacterium]